MSATAAFVPAHAAAALQRHPPHRTHTRWACCDASPQRTTTSDTVTTPDGATLHVTRHAPAPSVARAADAAADAPPPALLIHDFMTDRRLFSRLAHARALQARDLLAVDLRGFGASSAPNGRYSRTADLQCVAGDTRPHVVGVGLGGATALELALATPHAVRSVAVVGSGLPGHAWSSDALYLDISSARRAGRLLMAGAATPGSEADRDVVQWKQQFIATNRTWGDLLANKARRDVAREAVAMARDYSGFHFFSPEQLDPDPFSGEPLSARVAGLGVPACVMVGELDTADFRAIAAEIFAAVGDAGDGVVEVPGAGHFAVMEEAEFVAQRLVEFWDMVERREG